MINGYLNFSKVLELGRLKEVENRQLKPISLFDFCECNFQWRLAYNGFKSAQHARISHYFMCFVNDSIQFIELLLAVDVDLTFHPLLPAATYPLHFTNILLFLISICMSHFPYPPIKNTIFLRQRQLKFVDFRFNKINVTRILILTFYFSEFPDDLGECNENITCDMPSQWLIAISHLMLVKSQFTNKNR